MAGRAPAPGAPAARSRPLPLRAPGGAAPPPPPPRRRAPAPATASSRGSGSSSAPPPPRLAHDDRVGAEHGEGFVSFRLGGGGKTRLDVDALNEALAPKGAARIRYAMRPDEAHGLVFCWDDVVADAARLKAAAWAAVAAAEGLPWSPAHAARRALFDVAPERAARDVLRWTDDPRRARELGWLLAREYAGALAATAAPLPGVAGWLALAGAHGMPCALVSPAGAATTGAVLDRLGLRRAFAATVTADDDMETISQRLLSAALKLGRPPNACVAFTATPAGVTAAHNCSMRAVAVLGRHRAHELRAADLAVSSLAELSVYNVRRLFADQGAQLMDLRKQAADEGPARRRLRHGVA